ncbi:hypothetical protein BD413DRAFT_88122 [Trametes elegans]|nr:hypothetical protein BD413DRAFT_88122 [Trametes elegans]
MYDPRLIYPKMFHPVVTFRTRDWRGRAQHSTRTLRPVKYCYIDFGVSRRYNLEDSPPREYPIRGGDKSAPGIVHWEGQSLDPFPTDVYNLGKTIRTTVIQRRRVPYTSRGRNDARESAQTVDHGERL